MRRSTPLALAALFIGVLVIAMISGTAWWAAPNAADSWVVSLGSLTLGSLFCYAGASKLTRLNEFGRTLREFPMIRRLARTQRSALKLSGLISGIELTLGIALMTGRYVTWIAAAALALLAVFTLGLAIAWATKSTASCGCLRQSKKPVAVTDILRNVVVMLLVVIVIVVSDDPVPATRAQDAALTGDQWLLAAGAALACLLWVGLDNARRRWRPANAVDVRGGLRARRRDALGSSIALRVGEESEGAPARKPEVWAAFREVAAREREAARYLPTIEQPMHALVEEKYIHNGLAEPADFDTWIAQETELKALDDRLSGELQALYRQAAEHLSAPDGTNGVERCLRVALLHWCVTLRRRTMQGYHTAVDGLVDDPDCVGDLVADQLLMDYFDALAADLPSQTRAAVAVQALAAVARQTACIGQAQSAHLASALYWSYVEVAEFLRVNGLLQVAPYLAQAAFQPMLLLYDVEKHRGPATPLARWFDENADALLEGADSGRLPAHWHGLWLYDRRTGYLLGYQSSSAALTENDVSLPLFLQSLLRKQNMGRLDCSFAEMIERGPSRLGYLCEGSTCSDTASDRPLTRGHSWWFKRKAERLGLDEPAARQSTCLEPGGGEGADGTRGTRCADGLAGGGRDRISSSVACITERLVSPADRQLRCVSEAMGMCADPIEGAIKRLREVLFQGVKLGRLCQLADVQPSPYPSTSEENRRKNVEFAERRLREQIKAWAEAYAAREVARRREQEALRKYRDNPTPDTRDAYNDASIHRQTAENELHEAETKVNNAKDTLDKLYEEQNAAPSTPPNLVKCPPDTPQCGNNACTAMAAQAMAAFKCLEETGVANRPDVLRPWGDRPGVVDPSPLDDPTAPAWVNCLGSMNDVDPAQRLCWAVDCGHGTETRLDGAGRCGCRQLPPDGRTPGALHSTCGSLDCGEGSYPTLSGAGCRCQPIGGFDHIGSGGIIPPGNFAIPEAPLFREPHVQNLPEEFWPRRPDDNW